MTFNLVEHFDHFVVPVDDIVAAEDFYTDVFDCRIATFANGAPMRYGLNVHHRMVNAVPHTFFIVAGKRIGVYLQDEPRPKPEGVHGAPTCSFETTPEGLERIAAAVKARNALHEGPVDDDGPVAARSLYLNDPAGNHFHVYVPSTPRRSPGNGDTESGTMTGMGYLQLEAPDLEESVRFYSEIFGLEVAEEGRNRWLGVREVSLRLPSGQLLILTELPFAPKGMTLNRHEAGPHLAFYVPAERWDDLIGRLADKGIEHADRAVEIKDRRAKDLDTYFEEPAGYVVQLIGEKDF